ncbi:MAG TPA: J domain-containing protein [Phycisphaerae bacterium]|nr:J domain-containing protein [Phycisphaerae bacterium]
MRHRSRQGDPGRLEALGILGLGPGASQRQVKRAYRRLALRYHPDRNARALDEEPAQSDHQARFRQVAQAYAVLERGFVAARSDQRHGLCDRCDDFEPLETGLDGNSYCRECLLTARGKRALPAPAPVVAGCGLTMVGLTVSGAALAAWTTSGQSVYWWMSVSACAGAMIALAAVCLTAQGAVTRPVRGMRAGRRRRPGA